MSNGEEKQLGDREINFDKQKYDYQFVLNQQLQRTAANSSTIYEEHFNRFAVLSFEAHLNTFVALLSPYIDPEFKKKLKEVGKDIIKLELRDKGERQEYYELLLDVFQLIIKLMERKGMLIDAPITMEI